MKRLLKLLYAVSVPFGITALIMSFLFFADNSEVTGLVWGVVGAGLLILAFAMSGSEIVE